MKWFAAFNLVLVLSLVFAGPGAAGMKQLLLDEQVAANSSETLPEKPPQTEAAATLEGVDQQLLRLLVPALLLSVPAPLTSSSFASHFPLSRQQNGPPPLS